MESHLLGLRKRSVIISLPTNSSWRKSGVPNPDLAPCANRFHCLEEVGNPDSAPCANRFHCLKDEVGSKEYAAEMEEGLSEEADTHGCASRLDLLTSEVYGSGQHESLASLCGLGDVERNIGHNGESLSKMEGRLLSMPKQCKIRTLPKRSRMKSLLSNSRFQKRIPRPGSAANRFRSAQRYTHSSSSMQGPVEDYIEIKDPVSQAGQFPVPRPGSAANRFHSSQGYTDNSSSMEGPVEDYIEIKNPVSQAGQFPIEEYGADVEEGLRDLGCASRLDLSTSEVCGSAGEHTYEGKHKSSASMCGLEDLERNIEHNGKPLSKMQHRGVNLVCIKKYDVAKLDEPAGQFFPKETFYDYLQLEEDNPWSKSYYNWDDMNDETHSPSISCNLDKDPHDSGAVSNVVNIEHVEAGACEVTEIRINDQDLDWDKEIMNLGENISREEADIYLLQVTSDRSPAQFWVDRKLEGHSVSEPEELEKINGRLAQHRIKAHQLSKRFHNDEKKLEEDNNLVTFKERQYFVDYEEDFEWFFHPEYCELAGLDDYQRLVPKQQELFEYLNWDRYHQICSDYVSDKEYLQYYKDISLKLQWLKKYVHLSPESRKWIKLGDKAFIQALKIAKGYPRIFPYLIWTAYEECIWSLRIYSEEHDALHGVIFEVWKRFAKEKKSFTVALKEVHDQCMFPLYSNWLHCEVKTSIEHQFNTFMSGIHETASDNEVNEKIEIAVQNLIQKIKCYEQYAEKKIAIAKSIGLIT